ncbi:MAG: hypothetical protein LBU61_03365, partial [Coriobacteriales bacterium]|nr:hypothetical protein [Coriobacteriales bacterium]
TGTNIIRISGGYVATTDGNAIYATGLGSFVSISGGFVRSIGEVPTIETRRVYASSDSWIENNYTGDAIKAVGRDSEVIISDSTVSARNGYAIMTDDIGTVKISNSFVFAYGRDLLDYDGEKNVIIMFDQKLEIVDNSIICAWSTPVLAPAYDEGSTNDLITNPGSSAIWGKDGSQVGIYYANGSNQGFFPVNDYWNNIEINPLPPENDLSYEVTYWTDDPNKATVPDGNTAEGTDKTDGSSGSDGKNDTDSTTKTSGKGVTDTDDDNELDGGIEIWLWILFGGLVTGIIGCSVAFARIRKSGKQSSTPPPSTGQE